MKALSWKSVFATLNPSPVFEAVGMLAEEFAMKGERPIHRRLTALADSKVPKREAHTRSHGDRSRQDTMASSVIIAECAAEFVKTELDL